MVKSLQTFSDFSARQGSADCASEALGCIVTGIRYPEFEPLTARLQTYLDCPKRLERKVHDLATAGFYYTGFKDHTVCFFCGGVVKDWGTEDDPWTEHARWFPNCTFVIRKRKQGFVDYVQDSLRRRRSESLTPHQQRQVSRQQHLQQQRSSNKLQVSNRPTFSPTGNCLSKSSCPSSDHMNQPVYPQFANLSLRRNTFQEAECLNDQQTAETGFFYNAPGILVCFNCGGHLFTWKPGVNLWVEHARWFPNCTYLKAQQDQTFITDVQRRFEETETMELTTTTYPQTPQRSHMLTRRHNNLETSNPQSPTAADARAKSTVLKNQNQQNPIPSPRQDQTLPVHFGTQRQENQQFRPRQAVSTENAQEQILRPAIISNRNTSLIAQSRTVYSARVTRQTRTGQEIERYQWSLLCRICKEHQADVTLIPCRHTVCCRRCSRHVHVCCECSRAVERTEQV